MNAKATTPPPLDALPAAAREALEALRETPDATDAQSHARMRARFRAMLSEELGDEVIEALDAQGSKAG